MYTYVLFCSRVYVIGVAMLRRRIIDVCALKYIYDRLSLFIDGKLNGGILKKKKKLSNIDLFIYINCKKKENIANNSNVSIIKENKQDSRSILIIIFAKRCT